MTCTCVVFCHEDIARMNCKSLATNGRKFAYAAQGNYILRSWIVIQSYEECAAVSLKWIVFVDFYVQVRIELFEDYRKGSAHDAGTDVLLSEVLFAKTESCFRF
jgi:hypothetical protein